MTATIKKMSKTGIATLILLEGAHGDAYNDPVGLPTIGVGHLLTQSELSSGKIKIGDDFIRYENGLNNMQIAKLLEQDLKRFENVLNEHFPEDILTQGQFDALISFMFNVGVSAFLRSTLYKEIKAGRFENVPIQLRRWIYGKNKIIKGLVNRREAEIKLWLS